MKSKAIIYARVSSLNDRQDTSRQVNDLQSYAERHGYIVVESFCEHISGAAKNKERAALQDALRYAKESNIRTLLVSELSRIGRNSWEVLETIKCCVDAQLNIIFQKESLSLFNEDGNENPFLPVMVACLSMSAQLERENIKFRLQSGYNQFRATGGKVGRKEGKKLMTADKYRLKYSKLVAKLEDRKNNIEHGCKNHDDDLRTIAANYNVNVSTVQTIIKTLKLTPKIEKSV